MTEQHTFTQGEMDELAESVAAQLEGGESKASILEALVAVGFDRETTAPFVDDVGKMRQVHYRRGAFGSLLLGGGLIAAGVGITAWAYTSAGPGGSYIVAFGLPIVGVWRVIQGAQQWAKSRRDD